ncbi:hypothetical protein [Methylomonas rapida]|uniref:Uncharacterized protein n=1 Tax=Methylomonas rapida TaxID=2963939 RepID=A0ABY7GEV7_9GAMM|nr:hypothetical protein [Methylomonas rapida]WAR43354.1 hypothetical protein NM686_013250 [Methylomonas rapida]
MIWLYKRFSDGKPLDYHSAQLINYVIKNAYQSDFSFKNLEKTLNEYFSIKKPPTAEELKKAKVFLEKEYVQERIGQTKI